MDALTMADLKRMQKASLLTLEEFLKEATKRIKQAGDRAADDDDDVQIVGQARPYRWYSEASDDRRALALAPAPAAEDDVACARRRKRPRCSVGRRGERRVISGPHRIVFFFLLCPMV